MAAFVYGREVEYYLSNNKLLFKLLLKILRNCSSTSLYITHFCETKQSGSYSFLSV